jgi:hypothetical protein
MNKNNIDYSKISVHIPHVLQSLYTNEAMESTSLQEIKDAFRIDQLQCKTWMLDQMDNFDREAKILIIGSWLGFTSYCLYKMGFENITETDPDRRLSVISNFINAQNHRFIHLENDVNDIDLNNFDIVVNSSCEHILDNQWFQKIKPGTVTVLQSTNLKWHDHVNTADSLEEFKGKYSLKYHYADELEFNSYSRYMIIGEKI